MSACAHRLVRLVTGVVVAAGVVAQDAAPPVEASIAAMLAHDDGEVRGEAALALAVSGDSRHYPRLLALARHRDPQAAVRALVALGELGTAGAESLLGDVLLRPGHSVARRAAAAYALAILPDDRGARAVDGFLRRISGGGHRRHREPLAALLHGIARRGDASRAPALERLLGDKSYRDPLLRRLTLRAWAACDGRALDLRQWLRAEAEHDRLGALEAVLRRPQALTAEVAPLVLALATDDPSPEVRGTALRALTAARAPAALVAAQHALKSTAPVEVAAAVAAVRAFGAQVARRDLLLRALQHPTERVQQAMLAAHDRGRALPTDLSDACLQVARDRRNSGAVRSAAAALAARTGDREAVITLQELFLELEESHSLTRAAAGLALLAPRTALPTDLDAPATASDRRLQAVRIEALLRARHPQGGARLVAALQDERLGAGERARLLRAWRLRDREREPAALRALLPPVFAIAVLGDL